MVLFDAGILIKLLDAKTSDKQRQKLDYLIATLRSIFNVMALSTKR